MSSEDIGIYIRKLLNKRKLNQSQLSERTSISRQKINAILQGKVAEPKISTIISLARALNVHPIVLMRELFKGWEFPDLKQSGTLEPFDAVGIIQDTTYPDNSTVSINSDFIKTWEIQNIGKTVWENRKLICVDDELEIIVKNPEFRAPI